jgi:hypothetical protein
MYRSMDEKTQLAVLVSTSLADTTSRVCASALRDRLGMASPSSRLLEVTLAGALIFAGGLNMVFSLGLLMALWMKPVIWYRRAFLLVIPGFLSIFYWIPY